MPSRIIRDSCKTSPTLDQLSDGAERMFWRLVTVADDFGRFHADARALLASCFPLKTGTWKPARIDAHLAEMEAADLVALYEVGGRKYGYFKTFGKHQSCRAKESKFPSPTSENICTQMFADTPVIDDRDRDRDRDRGKPSCPTRAKTARAERGRVYPADFVEFWTAYPRKTGKGKALRVWKSLNGTRPPTDEILKAVETQKAQRQWQKDNGEFIPYPASWLNAHGWADEVKTHDPGAF